MSTAQPGMLYGVGVGPGDPELLTLKAVRLIRNADRVAYLANGEGRSQAREIARLALAEAKAGQQEIPVVMPMSRDRTLANKVYDEVAIQIAQCLRQGEKVVFLCEGDPLFFGSFAYLLERLQDSYSCHVVPGISSVNAAAATLAQPLTLLKESFAVVTGRHTDEQLRQTLQQHDSVVIMKAGEARPRILAALDAAGRRDDARYLEYIGRDNQQVEAEVAQLPAEKGPYFSLFVVTRHQRGDSG
ncbi:MAG: precorrin-2 C(20)-methyltransferase [Marinobacterium sp.]|nr:precorrin-2 C(20)-methyltransferase [Marinobacterium sp.]